MVRFQDNAQQASDWPVSINKQGDRIGFHSTPVIAFHVTSINSLDSGRELNESQIP